MQEVYELSGRGSTFVYAEEEISLEAYVILVSKYDTSSERRRVLATTRTPTILTDGSNKKGFVWFPIGENFLLWLTHWLGDKYKAIHPRQYHH